jgi:TM2 domain-containing membrane protein YozV
MPEERYDDLVPETSGRARAPSPGLAAVLSVLIPGLGHVYAGRLGAGLLWFLATGFGYWAIIVPAS